MWWLDAIVVASALAVALAFIFPTARQDPALRAAIETVIATFTLTGAVLLRAQFARSRLVRDLLLFEALLMLGVIEFFAYCLPAVLTSGSGAYIGAAGPFGSLCVAIVLAAAAWLPPPARVAGNRHSLMLASASAIGAIGVCELIGLLLHDRLFAHGTEPVFGLLRAVEDPIMLVLVLLTAGLFLCAAAGFVRSARFEQDSALELLAAACALLAGARLYYFAMPWLGPDWVALREGLRLAAFALVLAASVRRELTAQARIASAAAVAERRRVARDLHDGLAQDLALIVAHGSTIATQLGSEHPVTAAARRALAVSRGTISELCDPAAATASEALAGVAHELQEMFGIAVALHVELEHEPPPSTRENLTRIAREAIVNAARHGRADNVIVSLSDLADGLLLRVRDDGCGIGGRAGRGPAREGFGLRSMRERAAACGGHLNVRRGRARGTELEVVVR